MPLTTQAQAFLDALAEQDRPPWEELSPQEGREFFNGLGDIFGEGPELDYVEDKVIPGDVSIRVFRDDADTPRPAVMYFHGGGWVLGNTETHDALCRRIAKSSGCAVISVDYAISPENRFPKALEDCFAATTHVADSAGEFGIDPDRIAVAGDSAGGNLAAALTLKIRDEGGPAVNLQVLIYPVIEPDFQSESYRQFATEHGLTRTTMQWFWDQYLGDQPAGPLAAPSRAASHTGLPAAHVITAEYDVLRDEGEAYARQLEAAGVPTTCKRYDGNLHGFVHFAANLMFLSSFLSIFLVLFNHSNPISTMFIVC